MTYGKFDQSGLRILPLSERMHKMTLADVRKLDDPIVTDGIDAVTRGNIRLLARRMADTLARGDEVMWAMGAHVMRRGNSRYIIDLMNRGIITHLAVNMAVAIHDFEMAHIGATLEDVEFYIKDGRFGNWEETGSYLNRAAIDGYRDGIGLGEAVGRMIYSADNDKIPYKDTSIFNAAYKLDIPITVHKSIGYDITDQHPSADFAALGKTSGDDFLKFVDTISRLEHGVFLSLGSAVMGPEVYLKALSMARNVAHQKGEEIRHFTTGVFDIVELGNWYDEKSIVDYRVPSTLSDPRYYFRPLKSILTRTVRDGGEGFYVQGDFAMTVPCLYGDILELIR